jgi:type I restriction enzyme R subunit
MTTPEQEAEKKIEVELESQGWEETSSDAKQTGYSKYVHLPDGREADYVLYSLGRPVAIIEAKRQSKNPKNHLQQARNYAQVIEGGTTYSGIYGVPFVFASNGEKIVIDDLREGTPDVREMRSFYTPEDISRRLSLNISSGLEWLASHSHEDTDKELWENQAEAISNIKTALQSQNRRILVSMATGSGKTRLAMALTYQLLESGYAGRVLFVPDTEQLERDALQAFQSYDPLGSPRFSDQYITRGFDEYREKGDADVVVSTIQKAHYELKENPEQCSVGEFDVVVADECHRGIYNSEEGYGKVLDYYDSIEIGLTATPHQKTIQRYNNNHVYSYDYHEALDDDRVVPFRPYVIQTEATMDGIVYDGKHYSPSDFGTNVFIHDTHRKVAKEIIEEGDIENELTLVFAQNIDHANIITEDFREVFSEELDIDNSKEFVKTITSENRHAEATLDNFDDRRRNPRVAVTVDMVSTGVDIRPLNNLVFLRAVKSSILYNQMVGRGTRNTPQKEFFRMFDCIGVLDYHDDNMFSTENLDIQYPDSDDDGDSKPTEPPKEIEDRDIDRVIKQYQAYPLKNEFVEEGKFISEVSELIESKKEAIIHAVDESESIEEADNKIEKILSEEWRYFTQDYILDASSSHINSLFELTSEVLLGHNSIRKNSKRAKQAVIEEYGLSDEQQEWIQMLVERAVIEKETISKSQLLEKPFSDYGGYDHAIELFEDPDLDTLIATFNSELLSMSEMATNNRGGDDSTDETSHV